jgi:hypothetical protein
MFEFKEFLKFSEADIRGALRVRAEERYFQDPDDFIGCREVPQRFPIFKQYMGKKVYDLIGTDYPEIYILSRKFVNVLEENKFTGWKTYSVKIVNEQKQDIDGFAVLTVYGKCGPHIEDLSEDVMIDYPAGKFPGKKGFYFDPTTYDGSDIFLLGNSGHIIVHNRVKMVLEKAKISNVKFQNLTDITYSW